MGCAKLRNSIEHVFPANSFTRSILQTSKPICRTTFFNPVPLMRLVEVIKGLRRKIGSSRFNKSWKTYGTDTGCR